MSCRTIKGFVGVGILLASCAILLAQSLGTALDNTDLTWTTSSTGSGTTWFGQSTTYHFGGSAAQSGHITTAGPDTSVLQTTVTGPGTLTYWWKVATTTINGGPISGSSLALKANSVTQATITDNADWIQQTVYLGSGSQTVQWIFSYYTFVFGAGAGWVDQVTWTPGTTAPIINTQPPGQSIVSGLDATFRVSAVGTPPLTYQWRFDGTNFDWATNSSCVISNVQAAKLGDYCVVITNVAGSITSSVVPLVFGNVAAWGSYAYGETSIPNQCTNALAISAGSVGSLILNSDNTVTGWGYQQTNVPSNLTNVMSASAFFWHSLALKADGTMAGWGYDFAGDTDIPADLTNVVSLVPAGYHSLALRSDGTVAAWGDNTYGQTNIPAGLSNVVQIAGGSTYSVALQANGQVVEWGYLPFQPTNVPATLTNAVAIASGLNQCVALKPDGTVVTWGFLSGPAPGNATNVVAVASGGGYAAALKADGTVVAWGVTGTAAVTNVPPALTNVIAIAAGSGHVLALVGAGPPVQQVAVTNFLVDATGCHVTVPSQSGRVFRLEYKDDLNDVNWTALSLVAGTGNALTLTDPAPANTARFYRVRRW
jgi:hypothetical protein